jgi:anti-sigma factor RsiW
MRALSQRVRALPRHQMPPQLGIRIADALGQERGMQLRAGTQSPALLRRVASHAIAAAAGAIAVALLLLGSDGRPGTAPPPNEIVTAHVRGLMQETFAAMSSGNPHVLRPWFAGKIDFAPRVVDLADAGYPLESARIEWLGGQATAAVVYRRREHRITLFMRPRAVDVGASAAPAATTQRGFNLLQWRDEDFDFDAVSDLNRTELLTFSQILRQRARDAGG